MGTAASYGVLAGDSISNTGATTIVGDLGLHPGTSVTGSPTVTGNSNVTNAAALDAKNALRAAYLDADGRTGAIPVAAGALGGLILGPGLYADDNAPDSLGLTGTLTLDAGGDPSAVWIFQSDSTLITAVGSSVELINGAQACNVFWQVGSSATFNTSTRFAGVVMASSDITVNTNSTVNGRLLAGAQANGAGALTLDTNTITNVACAELASAEGADGGGDEEGLPVIPPRISLEKVPDPLALPDGPGPVTYTYTVKNPGIPALFNVTVQDDKCVPVQFVAGDTNGNARLENSETWIYRCITTLVQTTTNIATAFGFAGDQRVFDTDTATVPVAAPVPGLPNAGSGSHEAPWTLISLVVVGSVTSWFVLYALQRKHTI